MNKTCKIMTAIVAIAGFSQPLSAGGNAAAGKAIAEQTCQSCHGVDGNSADPQYPKLAGQHASYLRQALSDYKTGARSNPIMSGFAAGLSKKDQKDVSAWYSQQVGLKTVELE
ncbi:MAG: cytochrome c [Gammaproteobacteria bacterium]